MNRRTFLNRTAGAVGAYGTWHSMVARSWAQAVTFAPEETEAPPPRGQSATQGKLRSTEPKQTQSGLRAVAVVDSHVHFYDPERPEGVPWPRKDDTALYKRTMPDDYPVPTLPGPVAGVVAVEASPWLEDNQWLLDLSEQNPLILAVVGNLDPSHKQFMAQLDRFMVFPRFRGIRVGGEALKQGLRKTSFVVGVHELAARNLTLDVNGSPAMLPALKELAVQVPKLRIVVDHLAGTPIDGLDIEPDWVEKMGELILHKNVFIKVSGLVESAAGVADDKQAPLLSDHYLPWVDLLVAMFGDDRLMYGSNWPVCTKHVPLYAVHELAQGLMVNRPASLVSKFFSENAKRIYQWPER